MLFYFANVLIDLNFNIFRFHVRWEKLLRLVAQTLNHPFGVASRKLGKIRLPSR